MFKFIVLLAFLSFVAASDEANLTLNEIHAKVASGMPAPKGLQLDYAFLSVVFVNQAQICGGSLIAPDMILTSATCVSE
jgi:secreted trypsin-like serine protease